MDLFTHPSQSSPHSNLQSEGKDFLDVPSILLPLLAKVLPPESTYRSNTQPDEMVGTGVHFCSTNCKEVFLQSNFCSATSLHGARTYNCRRDLSVPLQPISLSNRERAGGPIPLKSHSVTLFKYSQLEFKGTNCFKHSYLPFAYIWKILNIIDDFLVRWVPKIERGCRGCRCLLILPHVNRCCEAWGLFLYSLLLPPWLLFAPKPQCFLWVIVCGIRKDGFSTSLPHQAGKVNSRNNLFSFYCFLT